MKCFAVLALALLGVAGAQSAPLRMTGGLQVQVYLSSYGLGLLALPRQAVAAIATSAIATPQQTVAGLLNSVDGGAGTEGWYMRAQLAAPSVVNLGALNLQWVRGATSGDVLGVRLGVLNTSVPLVCDGALHVVLQLDMSATAASVKFSAVGAQQSSSAARVEYLCAP